MPDQNRSGDVPPDVPPEYAEAYRRGYEQAWPSEPSAAEPTSQLRLEDFFEEESTEPYHSEQGPAHRLPVDEPTVVAALPEEEAELREERPRWLVPALLGGIALLLIVGAYGVGRLFSAQVATTDTSAAEPSGLVMNEKDAKGGGSSGEADHARRQQQHAYGGRVEAVAIQGATASCQSDSSVDAAGHQVDYAPAHVFDRDMTTAWRCDGSGVGQRLTLSLPGTVPVGEVGMVPGYAKTDPANGADRYAENNRITKVRWHFSDGTTVIQRFNGSAHMRDMQTKRIPLTKADRVTIEVLDSVRGPRNTVAVSEVRVAAAVGD
ncbi:MAG TPA: hypothetical protein VF049_16695 [Nocardioidaceae bacterium]